MQWSLNIEIILKFYLVLITYILTGQKNATPASDIIQAISMGIQLFHSIMGTLGPQQKLEEYFDILMPRAEKF